jgi:signal transduction histidine kinase
MILSGPLGTEGTELNEQLQGATDAIRRVARGLREVVNDLRLESEEGRPLSQVIELLLRRNRMMAPIIETSLEVGENVPAVPLGETGTQVSRIVREALTNARRHSGAQRISVRLRMEGGDLLAEVSDDGVGLGPGVQPGVGFASMRERAASIGGSLEIESEEGLGTSVRLRAPLPRGFSG